jgi:uncharacterized membrane protein YraQ (UPF0718 family)
MDLTVVIGIVVSALLWTLVAVLALTAAVRSKALCREGLWEGGRDFVVLIPRVLVGVVGSGYIAAVVPQEFITAWIGPNSGLTGITIAARRARRDADRAAVTRNREPVIRRNFFAPIADD